MNNQNGLIPLLVVVRRLDIGGTERHLEAILPLLDPNKFSVAVFSLRSGGLLRQSFIAKGLHVFGGSTLLIFSLAHLAVYVLRHRPLVHCFLPEAYLLGASTALVSGASACIMSRRSRNYYQRRHLIASWIEKRLHGFMDALIGNSYPVIQDLLTEGAPPERVHLIYNGIDPKYPSSFDSRSELRRVVRHRLHLSHHRLLISCVANLFPYKGHLDLLEAFALLGPDILSSTTLVIIGRDTGIRTLLEHQVARLGLYDSVLFLGERHDVRDLLSASDIGVLASHEEGFSNAVLEGMAAGLPMVVTEVGGNPDAVIHGESGYVVPPRAPAALASALYELIVNPELRQVMGAAAHRRVTTNFSIESCVSSYQQLYLELWYRYLRTSPPLTQRLS